MVNLVTVEVGDALDTGQPLELLDGTDGNNFLVVLAHPQRDGSTPVTVTRDVPIPSVPEPVAEATLADVGRDPITQ
jgi:hypothetical protein